MNFFDGIIEFFTENGYTLELLLSYSIFAYYFKPRKNFVVRIICSYAVLLLFSLLWNALDIPYNVLTSCIKFGTMYVIGYLGVLVCMDTTVWGALFCTIGGSSTQHLVYRTVSLILSFTGYGYGTMFASFLNVVLIAIIYTFVFGLFCGRLKGAKTQSFKNKTNILLGLMFFVFTAND